MSPPRIVLASASPRRLELLTRLGLDVVVSAADIDESVLPGEAPVAYVRRLSIEKAEAIDADPADLVIAADTTVDLDGVILGKPDDDAHVREMLGRLSSRTHRVHTGVTVRHRGSLASEVSTTLVTLAMITTAQLEWYVQSGEPFGKAGAYAIQGAGGVFVTSVEGSVSNVVGLPLSVLVDLARSMGVDLLGCAAVNR